MFARGSRQRDGRGARPERVVLGRGAEVVQNKRLLGISFQVSESAPRARGDGPSEAQPVAEVGACSPRTRGWSLVLFLWSLGVGLLPVHAGMVPAKGPQGILRAPAPCARGDGPGLVSVSSSL